MNRGSALAFLLALGLALALRLPALSHRPLHNDEGVNATKLAVLLERGEFRYDPHEYHGPTLHYASAVIARLCGVVNSDGLSDALLRVTPVLAGFGLLVLLLLVRDALGDVATASAALLTAVSPAMVFYSRYFIHEMLLVCFTLLALTAGWRHWQSRNAAWATLSGAGVGLMWATKETFVFVLMAVVIAVLGCAALERRHSGKPPMQMPSPAHLAIAALAAFVVGVLLFTSFGFYWRGALDSVLTYETWLDRAGGASPHIQPWHYYFERLLWFHPPRSPVWTEATILILAAMGAICAFVGNRAVIPQPAFVRFLAVYTVILAIVYAAIPYKTPWCLLGFWSGVLILAGAGVAALWRGASGLRTQFFVGALIAGVLAHLGWQAWRASYAFAADRRNPYVYAQTLPDALRLVERVKSLARLHADGEAMPVQVILPVSEWPLPWYLRSMKRIGWWAKPPDLLLAPVVVADANLNLRLDETPERRWLMAGLFELRPGVFLELYVERGLWTKLVDPSATGH